MGFAGRFARFGGGGFVGAGIGSAIAALFAPESGNELRRRLRERVRQVRLAGVQAQAAKTDELVTRFRATVNDPDALTEVESQAKERALASELALSQPPDPVDALTR